jgi:hypothetical protein
VFNLGDRVEGYTSPVHLLLSTAILALPGATALLKLNLASLILGIATLWQTTRLARMVGFARWLQIAAVFAVAGSWNFVVSASNGLETILVAFLVTGAAASLADHEREREWWRPATWTALLALSRPGAILTVLALAVVSLVHRRSRPWWQRIAWTAGPLVALAALLAFRIAYYGEALPSVGPIAWRRLTIAPFAVCLLRDLSLVRAGEAPEDLLLSDWPPLLSGAAWSLPFGLSVHAGR